MKDISDNIESAVSAPDFFTAMLDQAYGTDKTHEILGGLSERFVSLRTNRLKSTYEEIGLELSKADMKFERLPWSGDAFVLPCARERQIWDMNIYKSGKIYLQSLSSMLPPIAMGPEEGSDILDMTAAPGGKTAEIAAITNNKAHITACEMSRVRAEKLKYNLKMQGVSCAYVMVQDARRLDDFFSFDKILLDAPCSGSGTLNLNNSKQMKNFSDALIARSIASQTSLLRKAVKLLKHGGEIVYSTCSVLPRENEDVVKTVLSDKIKIVPIKFSGMDSLSVLPVKIEGTLCVCPDKYYEGFFMAKLKKE